VDGESAGRCMKATRVCTESDRFLGRAARVDPCFVAPACQLEPPRWRAGATGHAARATAHLALSARADRHHGSTFNEGTGECELTADVPRENQHE
jgi:hypothetical protein